MRILVCALAVLALAASGCDGSTGTRTEGGAGTPKVDYRVSASEIALATRVARRVVNTEHARVRDARVTLVEMGGARSPSGGARRCSGRFLNIAMIGEFPQASPPTGKVGAQSVDVNPNSGQICAENYTIGRVAQDPRSTLLFSR